MNKKDILDQIKLRDRITTLIDENKYFRVSAIKNTLAVQLAQKKHELPLTPAFFLARMLTASSLAASFLKGEERIILETDSNGSIGKIYAEAMQNGECRGFVRFDDNIENFSHGNLGEVLGIGILKVSKILYNESAPVEGIVELVRSDIETDLAYYYTQSEQVPTAVKLDVSFDDKGRIKHSGGIIVQAMPGAPQEEIEKIHDTLRDMGAFSDYLKKGMTPDKIVNEVLPFEFEILKSKQLDFFCRCSKESYLKKLITFGAKELKSMKQQGHNELVCQYCNSKYHIEEEDFDELLKEIEIKNN